MAWHENMGAGADQEAMAASVRAKLREGVVRDRDPALHDDLDVDRLVERVRKRLAPWWDRYTRPLAVTFPAANTARPVAHQLAAVPMGYSVLWADAEVHATPGTPWTREVAYVQAAAANAHAVLVFFTLVEGQVDA